MLFLINDVVMSLDAKVMAAALEMTRAGPLRFSFVETLAQEAFSEDPLLHRTRPERAQRLAALVLTQSPGLNGALFMASAQGCAPELVSCRFAQIDFEVMARLYSRQLDGSLTTLEADRQVWRRLAA